MNLLESAQTYIKNGFSVISTDNTKRSLFQWKKYQKEIPTLDELGNLFSHRKAQGIGVICGAVSGGLEVIDVDCKYGIDFNAYATEIRKVDILLYSKLLIVNTVSNGYHLYYRCEEIQGNQKLANRIATAEEIKENPNLKEFVLIETRGEGGYVIAPPSEGYRIIQNEKVPLISISERNVLFACARMFNQTIDEIKLPSDSDATSYGLKPWEDYNNRSNITELLEKHGWSVVNTIGERVFFKRPGATSFTSANYHTGKKVFYVFTTSSQFENKGYSPFAVFALLECNNDFKEATRRAVDMGYGEKKKIIDKKIVERVENLKDIVDDESKIVDQIMIEFKLSREEAGAFTKQIKEDSAKVIEEFWNVSYSKAGIPKIQINKFKLSNFLKKEGFGLYFHDTKSNMFIMIREKDGYLEEVSSEQVKKAVKEYCEGLPESFDKKGTTQGMNAADLLEVIYRGSETYFSDSFFEFMDHRKPEILRDDADNCYFAFANGIVVINKDDIKLKQFGEIKKSIWKSQVNFKKTIDIDLDFDPQLCEYYRFLEKICGEDDDRMHYALTLIGYILHSYKDPSRPFAPILAEETEDESKGGGTGKGIFFRAISELIPTVRIDGKNFKPDKPFAFQRVQFGTKFVVIEDCPKNVDFERYYPTITEGMTVEKKNKDEIFLSYTDSPKIAFTTNYSISNNADHAKRRQKVFEFSSFFNAKFTPVDLFGHKLFDNWDDDEYNKFYNLMFFCVKLYLLFGIKDIDNSDKLKRKNIKLNFTEEFLEYFDDILSRNNKTMFGLSDEWKNYLNKNELDKKDYSLKRFKKALDISCSQLNFQILWSENRQMNNIKQFKIMSNDNK